MCSNTPGSAMLVRAPRPEQWQSYDGDTRLCRWNRVQLLDDFRTPVTVVLVVRGPRIVSAA